MAPSTTQRWTPSPEPCSVPRRAMKSRLGERPGHERLRAEGGGPRHQLVFTDRVIATVVILRFRLPYAALAVFYGADRSTVTRAVHEIRPLLALRGFAAPGEMGLRLHTLADVFAYATAKGVELRLDGTEVCLDGIEARVRRPEADSGRKSGAAGVRRSRPCSL
ncbi:helix-turn-helix domain-containing protein [Streptomyces avermitilis]|uniref:helix-turn-helix domain-containing protein n=2 Tax=Streptomyces avermitilis TaxID=33903 RepID=UPI003721F968